MSKQNSFTCISAVKGEISGFNIVYSWIFNVFFNELYGFLHTEMKFLWNHLMICLISQVEICKLKHVGYIFSPKK